MRQTVNHRTKKETKRNNTREINIVLLEKIDNTINEDVKEFKNIINKKITINNKNQSQISNHEKIPREENASL